MSAQSVSRLAHVDRGQATARVARLQDAAIRADGDLGPVAHLHLMARDAACGVAAGRREGPVGVVEDKPEVGGVVGFDYRKLVEADAAMTVRQRARKLRRHRARGHPRVDHDEIVAQPMHLHEGQAGMACDVRHGRAYTRGPRSCKVAPDFPLTPQARLRR
jgi:hypothetical protein